ncbi:septation protein SpoVG family protein [Nitrospina gracilis]|uniref:septation protein SpoVG family protein n=1 Tax=Nitrospina gracilis TaxID=35801 RepID=UPI001F3E15ED|nr:septation protein SpoVG family protein [Nitrospina gracilis]MCF8720737.1 DNA-binding cell septation regulator SpoVG [Nitrospina gracilis Nb-211]
MTITKTTIYPFEPGAPYKDLKAYAEVTLEGVLTIKGIQVYRRSNGAMYIRLPSQLGKNGEYKDLVVAETPDFQKHLRDTIVVAYKAEMGEG